MSLIRLYVGVKLWEHAHTEIPLVAVPELSLSVPVGGVGIQDGVQAPAQVNTL